MFTPEEMSRDFCRICGGSHSTDSCPELRKTEAQKLLQPEKQEELKEKEMPFKMFQKVRVLRSSGKIENGWWVTHGAPGVELRPNEVVVWKEEIDQKTGERQLLRKIVTIEDLKKWNEPEKTEAQNLSQPETIETLEKPLNDFIEFIKKHEPLIQQKLAQGEELWEIFYENFYSQNPDKKKEYSSETLEYYSKSIKELEDKLIGFDKRSQQFLYTYVREGAKNADTRFYINLSPEKIADFYYDIVVRANTQKIPLEIKIPRQGTQENLNRCDKMVIYCNSQHKESIVRLLENLYSNYHNFFEEDVPPFTAGVKDSTGNKLRGISMAAESFIKNESFGSIRCKILEDVYQEFKKSGLPIEDFDFKEAFVKACRNYRVNPENPSLNL